MKRPTVASLKKVTPENLARLGPERLADILCSVAASRPELKRRLRMELAAEQGSEHLLVEIDRRLASLQTSGSRVSWRQRGAFVRDLEGLRALIAGRLAALDRPAAQDRLIVFFGLAPRVRARMRDKDGEGAAVFGRAAADLPQLADPANLDLLAGALAAAIAAQPADWAGWLPAALEGAPPELAERVLRSLSARTDAAPSWMRALRHLADAAGNLDAWRATLAGDALKDPAMAAELAQRLLAAGRTAEAGEVLRAAAPQPKGVSRRAPEPDYAWESAWIVYLDRSGDANAAQAVRWASFERTLSAERVRDYTGRLGGFDDVEAEQRAFAHAQAYPDFEQSLAFLIDWPALPEAARLIETRADEAALAADIAELWSARLRPRFPKAAQLLLRKAAAAAFRRREFAACDRLTAEADSFG